MDELLIGAIITILLFILTFFLHILKVRIALAVGIVGLVLFALWFVIQTLNNDSDAWAPLIFMIVCAFYIYIGTRTVPFKTQTAVFSTLTKKPLGIILETGTHWIDPVFEISTVDVHGTANVSLDLQELKIEIPETPELQTKTRGIKAKVKHIVFMLKLMGDIAELFKIEGGAHTIRENIKNKIQEFFLDKIGHTDPVDLDTDKGKIIENLAEELKEEINHYCDKNDYPYKIVRDVTIGDTELEGAYYQALAEKAFTILKQQAEDKKAQMLKERLIAFGKGVLKNQGSPKEQLEAAMIALGITPKSITDNKYSFDATIANALTDIARILKAKP